MSVEAAAANVRDYVESVATVDLRAADGVDRDPVRVRRLIAALARSTASEVTISTLAKDETSLSRDAVRDYLAALTRIFVVEDQPAWSAHLRSSATLRKEQKRHFCDPSIAVAALGADAGALQRDLEFTGQLFESLVVQHLRVYSQASHAVVAHARDSSGGEADAIVHYPDGSWAGFEVKLGASAATVEGAAASLKRFAESVVGAPPLALTVITATGASYRRSDGVNVVALPALTT